MKTKILGLVIAIVMVVATLASCNFGGSNGDGGGSGNGGNGGGNGTGDNGGTGGNGGGNNTDSGITYDYNWTKTDILVQLTENSNGGELSSGCRRYYAGDDKASNADIDKSIRLRNLQAAAAANVNPRFIYSGSVWGENIDSIISQTISGTSSSPDIFCNFVYDMTSAALRGCFANLLNTDAEKHPDGNFFRFNDDDYNPTSDNYFDSEAGEGYLYQYMESLSLTPDSKIYCLASDYTTDVVRSFLVMPVSVKLIEEISVTDSPIGDADGDGDHDIEDFYKVVWEYGWNYDLLAAYSQKAFSNSAGTTATELEDERIGCAISIGGLQASGLLYTTSVEIIKWDETKQEYYYPTTNAKLSTIASALNELFSQNGNRGVMVGGDAAAIKAKFAENGVLFGNVIAVGSLEDTEYQKMKSGRGFGVVPVPLYDDYDTIGDKYQTLVHNIARVMAISMSSTEFSQCTAFLDYQSRSSAAILNEYYENQLAAAVGGVAGGQNAKMLTYIRNHVRNCFDKTYEDCIAGYMKQTDGNAEKLRWHHILFAGNYQVPDMSVQYEGFIDTKIGYLETIYETWAGLE